MKKIIVYSTTYCGYCKMAKGLLNELNISFDEVDLTNDSELRVKISDQYKWMSVPMIVIGDTFVGGFDDLKKLHDAGKLTSMVE